MSEINSVGNNHQYTKTLSKKDYKDLDKTDDASIWEKFDTDNNGTITDKELNAAGYLKQAFADIKNYLIQRFGKDKITNVEKGETYFDYGIYYQEPKVVKSINDIPLGSHNNIHDARFCDISNLNLTEDELLNLCIDKTTVLSPEQKKIVDFYTEKCKDPGLGIRNLHEQGLTGKGVKMAIIDQPLGKHKEYSKNIKNHTDINSGNFNGNWSEASMHGAAVTSIAVGKTVGVAPDADVDYYSAVNVTNDPIEIEKYRQRIKTKILESKDDPEYQEFLEHRLQHLNEEPFVSDNRPFVEAINKILDKNATLPPEERTSVISISWGFDPLASGFDDYQKALARAKEEGVFIVSTRLDGDYQMNTCGLNRNPKGDLDSANSYEAGAFFKEFSENASLEEKDNLILIPMDHRTVADQTDDSSYRYEGNDGGMSWSTPWLAGMYALAKQAKPDVTPEEFWDAAKKTSDECHNNDSNVYVGRVINPQKLIEAISK